MSEYQRYEDSSLEVDDVAGNSNVGRTITLFLVGMGVGAAAALLLAPMSGHDLRSAIGNRCRRAMDGISEQTRNLRERGSNLLGFSRRKA